MSDDEKELEDINEEEKLRKLGENVLWLLDQFRYG